MAHIDNDTKHDPINDAFLDLAASGLRVSCICFAKPSSPAPMAQGEVSATILGVHRGLLRDSRAKRLFSSTRLLRADYLCRFLQLPMQTRSQSVRSPMPVVGLVNLGGGMFPKR